MIPMASQMMAHRAAAGGGGGSSHTYWRIYASAPATPSDNCCIDDLVFRSSLGGSQLATGGSSIHDPGTDAAPNDGSNIFDGTPGDGLHWYTRGGYPHWVGYHFATAVSVTHFSMRSHPAVPGQSPGTFKLEYSDDGTTWTDSGHGNFTASWSGAETKDFVV